MSTTENNSSNAQRPPPSDPNGVAEGNVGGKQYQVKFYPGFASAISVNGTPLYKQKGFFVLPGDDKHPRSSHAVEISCPSHGYTLTLNVDDPSYVIDKIEVTLRDPGATGGGVTAQQAGTTITVDNAAATCPPICK
jgi:hypothetical protein